MTRLPRFHVYLLLSERGEIYTGYTRDLRDRFKEHNSDDNAGWTKGRRWRLLAVRCFLDKHSAILAERQLKRSRFDKDNWITRHGSTRRRFKRICGELGIEHRLL